MDSFSCPICFDILKEPIDLPCKHTLCRQCLESTVSESAIQCPICRFRISNWLRKAKNTSNLVNHKKWEYIQANLKTLQMNENIINNSATEPNSEGSEELIHHQFAKPGELRAEYEAQLARQRMMREAQLKSEEEASLALVKQLELEDLGDLNDEMSNEVQPDSVDSITSEMNSSFQPIVTFPTTPPKHVLLKSPERTWPKRLLTNDKENQKRSIMEEWLNISPISKVRKTDNSSHIKKPKLRNGHRNLRSKTLVRPLRSNTINESGFQPFKRT